MNDDAELLRRYVRDGCETAFATLVERHVHLIYSAALRQLGGDAHLAEDVTQAVFLDLARKARGLTGHTSLAGWLYTSAHFAAANARRASNRRRRREEEAYLMNTTAMTQTTEMEWERLAPALDEAMQALRARDQHAILLRFFQGKTLAAVGHALGLNENAARKRVERALDGLRRFFARRGITISTVVLTDALASQAISQAPAGLAALVTNVALTGTVAAPAVTVALLKFMSLSKMKIAGGVIVAGLTGGALLQTQTVARLERENRGLHEQMTTLQARGEPVPAAEVEADPSLPREQFQELLRLRGEVGVLKRQLAEAAQTQRASVPPPPRKPSNREDSPEEQQGIVKMKHAQELLIEFFVFAEQNGGQLPASFKEAVGNPAAFQEATNLFEVVYQGALPEVANPARTIVFREREAWPTPDGGWARTYAFADGHTEIHKAVDGNFEWWEEERSGR